VRSTETAVRRAVANATVVKKPKTFCALTKVECIVVCQTELKTAIKHVAVRNVSLTDSCAVSYISGLAFCPASRYGGWQHAELFNTCSTHSLSCFLKAWIDIGTGTERRSSEAFLCKITFKCCNFLMVMPRSAPSLCQTHNHCCWTTTAAARPRSAPRPRGITPREGTPPRNLPRPRLASKMAGGGALL